MLMAASESDRKPVTLPTATTRLICRFGWSSAVLAASTVLCATAQPPQSPRFQASADLVRLEATVSGLDGVSRHGLEKADFVLLVGGRPHPIDFFEEVTREPSRATLRRGSLPADVADNRGTPGSLVVIVLDDFHFHDATAQARTLAARVVNAVGPHAAIAILTPSGRTRVEFTSDPVIALEAIDAFVDRSDPAGRPISPGLQSALSQPNHGDRRQPLIPSVRGPRDPGRLFSDVESYQLLRGAAHALRQELRRRKALVWISSRISGPSSAVTPRTANGASAQDYLGTAFSGALTPLRAANVMVYALSPTGTAAGGLREIATSTGGFVMKANTLEQDLTRLVEDLTHHYVIGFVPHDRAAADQPVTVALARADLEVHARRVAVEAPAGTQSKSTTALTELSRGFVPSDDLPVRLFAAPAAPRGTVSDVSVVIEVPCAEAQAAGFSLDEDVQYAIFAVDLRQQRVVRALGRHAYFKGRMEKAGNPRCQIITPVSLKSGAYQLRASVFSRRLSRGGSAYLHVDVPAVRNGVGLGGIVLGASAPDVASNLRERNLFPFVPALDRSFGLDQVLRVFVPVRFEAGTPPQAGRIEVADERGTIVFASETSRPAPALDATVALKDLRPGVHRIRAQVSTAEGPFSREVEIFVLGPDQ